MSRSRKSVNGRVELDSTTTATTVLAAVGANDLVSLTGAVVTNEHASSDVIVDILDGSTVKATVAVKAGTTGGFSLGDGPGINGTLNTAWKAQCRTSVSKIDVTLVGCIERGGQQ